MTDDDTDEREYVVHSLHILTVVGVSVGIGVVGLLAIGIAGGIRGVNVASMLQLLLIGVLFWPVYRLRPWRAGVVERVQGWVWANRAPLLLSVAIIWGSRLQITPDLIGTIVHLPFVQTEGFFFGAEVFYRPYFGFELSQSIRRVGQWYVTVFFVLLISVILIDAGKAIRSMLSKR